jgi:hypothetical protein
VLEFYEYADASGADAADIIRLVVKVRGEHTTKGRGLRSPKAPVNPLGLWKRDILSDTRETQKLGNYPVLLKLPQTSEWTRPSYRSGSMKGKDLSGSRVSGSNGAALEIIFPQPGDLDEIPEE